VDVSNDGFMAKTTDYIGLTNENPLYSSVGYSYLPSDQSPDGATSYYHALSDVDGNVAFPRVDDGMTFSLLNYSLNFSLVVNVNQSEFHGTVLLSARLERSDASVVV
jgi:hypothetical protein